MQLNKFEFSDCWLLLSIGFNKKGSTIKGIISSGDIYNHAIFSTDELNYGMSKLIENGYAIKERDRFLLTEKARVFYRLNEIKPEGCIETLFRLSKIFSEEKAIENCKLTIYFKRDKSEKICIL